MPEVPCPISGCTYVTPDVDSAVLAALITAHSLQHATPATVASTPCGPSSTAESSSSLLDSPPEEDANSTCDDDMPAEIKLLLCPEATNWEMEYRNEVVRSIFKKVTVTSMASMSSYVNFCVNQRGERLKLAKKYQHLLEMQSTMESSEDGRWVNVRKFREVSLIGCELYSSGKQTVLFLSNKIKAFDEAAANLEQRKARIQSIDNIAIHHLNTIDFLREFLIKLNDQKLVMESVMDEVERKLQGKSNQSNLGSLVKKGKKAMKDRRKEVARRNEKDKLERLYRRTAHMIMKILITPREDIIAKVYAHDLEFALSSSDVDPAKMNGLVVRSYLDPLIHLFEAGVFNDDSLLHDQVSQRIKTMKEEKEKTSQDNLLRKEREGKKAAHAAKQKLISPSGKTTVSTFTSPPPSGKRKIQSTSPQTPITGKGKQRKITLFTEKSPPLASPPSPSALPTVVELSDSDDENTQTSSKTKEDEEVEEEYRRISRAEGEGAIHFQCPSFASDIFD